MGARSRRRESGIIFRNGKPTAITLDIDDYRSMLELLEDAGDLIMLTGLRQKPLKFMRLEDFLKELEPRRTMN